MPEHNSNVPSNEVYHKIRNQILHIELPPGTAISEIETANKYNLSRTPIREVFKKLEADGLLEIRPHIGTFVTQIDMNLIPDMLYARNVIERAILQDVALIYDSSQDIRLQIPLSKQKELLESDLPFVEMNNMFLNYDNRFHEVLYDIVGKSRLAHIAQVNGCHYERFRALINLTDIKHMRKGYEEHLQIVELIRRKDLDALSELITHHIYNGFRYSSEIIARYPDYFVDPVPM